MPYAKVNDINLYYEIHGEGEPLVTLPGGGGTVESFLPRTQPFTGEFRVVVSDVRGIGRSDAPDTPYTMEVLADDLAGLLITVGINSAHVYGESFGGALAQYFTIRHPQKVKSLILISTICRYTLLSEEAKKATVDMVKMTPEERAKSQVEFFVTQDFAEKNPEVIRQMVARFMRQTSPTPGYIRSQQSFSTTNTYERLPEIEVPTLVIHGDADRVIPAGNAHILASRIPHAELKIFKNVGHFFLEAPGERDRAVLDFLRQHSSTGKGVT